MHCPIHHFALLLFITNLFSVTYAFTLPLHEPRSHPLPTFPLSSTLIHQFPLPTWIENLAATSHNNLLTTLLTTPDIYSINPAISLSAPTSPQSATLIHTFPTSHALLGITEVQPNQFYILGGNLTLATFQLGLNTNILYSINLSHYNPATNTGAVIHTVAPLSGIDFGNGIATLSVEKGLVVVADSSGGKLWIVDVRTGSYSVLLQMEEMAPLQTTGVGALSLGINGVHVLASKSSSSRKSVWIYFTNTSKGTLHRIPLCLSTLTATGPIQLLTTISPLQCDDFAIDDDHGEIYLACSAHQIIRVPIDGGDWTAVLGGLNQSVVAGPTSLTMGRGVTGKGVLYVGTNGGLVKPVNETFMEGGKVLELEFGV